MMPSKGAQYSKIFRKAGLAWGKGNLQRAVAILEAGLELATRRGDTAVARVMQQDLEQYRHLAASTDSAPLG